MPFNTKTKTNNTMFFQEEDTGTYQLHAYMELTEKKANHLRVHHELFN